MPDKTSAHGRSRTYAIRAALIGAGLAAGAVAATAIGAHATTNSYARAAASSSANSDAPSGQAGDHRGAGGGHAGEKSLDASTAAKLKAAALKAVPGGTVDRVETDSGDATYEAHMTRSDGAEVTVKFDKNLSVVGVEAGMGK